MAHVESGNWVMNAAEREQQRVIESEEAKRVALGGQVRLQPGKVIKAGLRILSVVRIIVAALTPGVSRIHLVKCT
jgi:inner membrane protein COX18